jgi:hypothetical protein
MGKQVNMPENVLLRKAPEIEEQMQHVSEFIEQLQNDIKHMDEHKDWMELEINMQRAIYQSLQVAKWLIEMSTEQLKKEPGNQPKPMPNVLEILDEEIIYHKGQLDKVEDVDKMLISERVATLMCIKHRIEKEVCDA